VDKFRSETKAITPDLLEALQFAWRSYIRGEVAKGVPEDMRPSEGQEDTFWQNLVSREQNLEWKQECLKRNEKFDMTFNAAVCENHIHIAWALMASIETHDRGP
jgi:cysteinyl-tRNA synthetase